MTIRKLNQETVDMYIAYLQKAVEEEPEMMTVDRVDETGIRRRVVEPFYQKTTSLLAVTDNQVVGRIEFHFYGCMQDGYKMAYVDWVYVLPQYRRRGIAQELFGKMEEICRQHNIDQYYLIRAENKAAESFYRHFLQAELSEAPILRKSLLEKA